MRFKNCKHLDMEVIYIMPKQSKTYKYYRKQLDVFVSREFAQGISFIAYIYQLCKRSKREVHL